MPTHSSTAGAGDRAPSVGIIGASRLAARRRASHEVAGVQGGQLGGFVIGEAEPDQAPAAPLVHLLLEGAAPGSSPTRWPPGTIRRPPGRPGRRGRTRPTGRPSTPARRGVAARPPPAARPQRRVGPEVLAQVPHGEGDVAGLVLEGEVGDAGGHGIGRVALEERQERQKRPLAQHRQQEGGDRPVRLVEQGLQRRPATGPGDPELAPAESGPAQ